MMRLKKYTLSLIFLSLCSVRGMNLFEPYDTLIRPYYSAYKRLQIYATAEFGYSNFGKNCDGIRVNVLQIWNCDQDALAMLDGFDPDTPAGEKRIVLDADDNGVRGHFKVTGDLDLLASWSLNVRWFFHDTWSLGVYFPFYAMRLRNVCWRECTQNFTDQDLRVKQLLTDNFFANVCTLGNGLDLQGWTRVGPGDITTLLEWYRDFPQRKRFLRNARLNWRFGFSLPTGFREDEDKILALPFGYDGAIAMPFGVGLDLCLSRYVNIGADVQLTHIFGNTRTRRIKTTSDQTELLLLEKLCAYKDYGMTQRFNIYVEFFKFLKGLSFLVGYQFKKHGDDTLSFPSNAFSAQIANSAEKLQEWSMHHMIVRANYDFVVHTDYATQVRPQLEFFARLPFNGRRIAVTPTVGMLFSIDF